MSVLLCDTIRVQRSGTIPRQVQTAFDEGLLSPLTFERRINVVLLIAPHFLKDDEVKSLKSDLNELRTIRNSMAHKPFWFHPELNDKGEVLNFVPMIQRGKAPIALTTLFIEELNEKIGSLIERSSKLATTVVGSDVGDHKGDVFGVVTDGASKDRL